MQDIEVRPALPASYDGDAVLVPVGTYVLTERLDVDTNIAIIGENRQLCVIETSTGMPISMYKGGLLKKFTINATRTDTGTVVYLYGDDESTDTLINVPYLRDVTINVTIPSGTTSFAVNALFWYWDQNYSTHDLAGAGTITILKDVYVNIIDNRTGISYRSDGVAGVVDANSGSFVMDNVNVFVTGGYTNLGGIDLTPNSYYRGIFETRNCNVRVIATGYTTYAKTTGLYLQGCDAYSCKVHVASLEEAFGVQVLGGPGRIVRDSEIYVEGQSAWGITNYSEGLDVINCQVKAVAI